jgi:hypothetical protein
MDTAHWISFQAIQTPSFAQIGWDKKMRKSQQTHQVAKLAKKIAIATNFHKRRGAIRVLIVTEN